MKKNYLFFLAILLSIQSFGMQYEYEGSTRATSNTTLFTSKKKSNLIQCIYSPSDFAAVSPSGNIVAFYMKASTNNEIDNLRVKMGEMGLKHLFNILNLK